MPRSKSPTFGSRVRKLRESAGLSVAQLAEKAGLQKTHLHALENGTKGKRPAWETVIKLAAALGVGPEKFLGKKQNSP